MMASAKVGLATPCPAAGRRTIGNRELDRGVRPQGPLVVAVLPVLRRIERARGLDLGHGVLSVAMRQAVGLEE
jgi:hypothetical protein